MSNQKSSDELQANEERELTESEKAIRERLLAECSPPGIDKTLLSMIKKGSVQLTDDLFFELLKETPSWLKETLFLKKIVQWQYIAGNAMFDTEEQEKARKNLMGISKALAFNEKRGAPVKKPEVDLYRKYIELTKLIQKIGGKKALLEKHSEFKEYLPYIPSDRQHRTPNELAIHILVSMEKVSERTLRSAIKIFSKKVDL